MRAIAVSMALANTLSAKVAEESAARSLPCADASRMDSIHSSSFVNRKIAALAVSWTKLASSMPSPASASANLMASALYSSMAVFNVLKLPVDLDIFSPLRSRCPLVRKPRGHLLSSPSQIAV